MKCEWGLQQLEGPYCQNKASYKYGWRYVCKKHAKRLESIGQEVKKLDKEEKV